LFYSAFCYSLYDDVVQRRPNRCYDDECCIAPGELDDDVEVIEQRPKVVKKLPSSTNDSVKQKTKSDVRETESPARSVSREGSRTEKQIPTTIADDEDALSVKEIMPKKKSPSPQSVRLNFNTEFLFISNFFIRHRIKIVKKVKI
jgi:hypothetical protein